MNRTHIRNILRIAFKSRAKVTVIFLLSLGIPSAFLLFLAVRGVEYDRTLTEQRLLAEHRGIADTLVVEVDKEILLIEQRLLGWFDQRSLFNESDTTNKSSRLIDELFVLVEGDLVYPYATLMYDSDDGPSQLRVQTADAQIDRMVDEAERNEFQLKNYVRAGELYRAALNRSTTDETKADLYMRLARVHMRMEEWAQAEETFGLVAERYEHSILPGGLPGGLAARLELIGLSHRAIDINETRSRLISLYGELIGGTWSLRRSQFKFARNKIELIAGELENSDIRREISDLGRTADSMASRTDYLLELGDAVESIILDSAGAPIESATLCERYVVTGPNGRNMLLVAKSIKPHPETLMAVGVIVDHSALATETLPQKIEQIPVGRNATLVVRSDDGKVIYGELPPETARLTVSGLFKDDFPSWKIELYQNDPQFFERLISGRQSFYIYALLTVVLVMIFGTIMTARMMSRELELARMKSDFVSTVSHEFRSPLTSIRQMAEMLKSGRVLSDERREQYYEVILEQSERLSLLVSNILDLAKIDEQRFTLDYEKVDVKQLLETIVLQARQQAGDESIAITLDTDSKLPIATLDGGAVTHIMKNLIDNAIKYSSGSPEITITARSDNHDLVITVEDRGIGIPKGEVDKVFERFYRVGDEFTRKVKGTGLGLALVRELVHAHGGTIKLSSEIQKGSSFTIRLPVVNNKESNHG